MRIAIDAMGGDHAPDSPVAGAREAVHAHPSVEAILVGDPKRIGRLLGEDAHHPRIRVVPASEVIEMAESPVHAVRKKTDSSMVRAIRLIPSGAADAVISAGNTGALMAAGLFILGRMPGIERPALTAILPVFQGWGLLLLDVGANLDPKPSQMYQYGLMGSLYCHEVYGIDRPRVALLNVGVEAGKGTPLVKETHHLLKKDSRLHFIGNLEARELLQGKADVVVADGFSGNIALKLTEGLARDLMGELRAMFLANWRSKLSAFFLRDGLRRLKGLLDYQEYGGAPLLGLDQALYKCHGSSEPKAFRQAILIAEKHCARGSQARIRDRIQEGDFHGHTGGGSGTWDVRPGENFDQS
ncbi:MAG: phosphate acyltransferase PlsX [Thermaerobacter sp.]|nr:phosphate acyltransferase PlsX [Thermaerobacter sp.]